MLKGFESETGDSQLIFRKLLIAMAGPGSIQDMELDMNCPGNLYPASGAILLTLLDFETPFRTDFGNGSRETQWIQFHTGAPVENRAANPLFVLWSDDETLDDPSVFNPGTLVSPEISTTLIVQTRGLENNGRIRLTGPGIQNETHLELKGIKDDFIKARARMTSCFPLGIDMIFTCENRFVAIPRTTILEVL
jgi:alpha-D-ribose 1-methylphosphonate 5-triphosphate synthase subunit PhnH